MVSDVIVPPAGVTGAGVDGGGWVTLAEGLEPRALELPALILVPPFRRAAVPAPPTLRIWDVLGAWRTAERELAETRIDNPDWPGIHAELVGLRAAYHRMFHERMNSTDSVSRSAGTTLIVWR
jgi:hypothetical protein